MKNRWLRLALYLSAVVLAVSLLAATTFFREAHRPDPGPYNPDKDPLNILLLSEKPVDPAVLRAACHRVISAGRPNCHDAYLTLQTCGDKTSIPLLIRALRHEAPPTEEGNLVCTTGHCIEALSKLTGRDFGYDPDKWQAWWDVHQNESMPVEAP